MVHLQKSQDERDKRIDRIDWLEGRGGLERQ
jgi:hypothetical protein